MEASFTAIARGITHADLNAELAIIMADDETARLWKKIFIAHEKGTLMNPDKPGSTYLDEYLEAQQRQRARHEKKSGSTFEEKPYVCKPLTRETFRVLAGLTKADYLLCAKRILEVRPGEEVPRVTFRSTKNSNVSLLKSWCIFRKWKNILLQELSARDPKDLGIWGKDAEGAECLNRSVWSKFKKDHCISKAKWVKLYQVATDSWLNKKRMPNNKFLDPPPACLRLLNEWHHTDLEESEGQVITRYVEYNALKRKLLIPVQDKRDLDWMSKFTITGGVIDFRFIPGCVDQPVSSSVVESLVKYFTDPIWSPGLKTIPAWMIVSDLRNHNAAEEFISAIIRKHPQTFLNIPSVYLPCHAENYPFYKEVDCKRESPMIYVDFLTCPSILPGHKIFRCPMMPPEARRYNVNPKEWSELSYEVTRGELRMEVYLSFLSFLGSTGGVVINLFGGLKPIAAALVCSLQHPTPTPSMPPSPLKSFSAVYKGGSSRPRGTSLVNCREALKWGGL